MSENNGRNPQEHRINRIKRKPMHWVMVGVIGILIVLILANFDAILKPIDALNAILAPIFIGLVLAYICNPFLRFFEKKVFYRLKNRRTNQGFSMLLTYMVLLLIIAAVALLIIPQLVDSINDLRHNGLTYINSLIDQINEMLKKLPLDLGENQDGLLNIEKVLTLIVGWLSEYSESLLGNIGVIAGSAITFLKNLLVGVFVSIYVLLSKDRLSAGARRILHAMFSDKNEEMLLYYTRQANSKFGGFLVGKLVDSFMVGVTCLILFSIFKIPYPILIATIIGVTDFIPFFGPFIGAIPSAVIILIASPSKAIVFVILILVVQQIDGNLIAPLILGDHTGLTSLGVLIAITLMGGLLGFIGLLLGVPLFALIMTILDDYIKVRLRRKGSPTDLYSYYSADAFIRPVDEMEAEHATMTQKIVRWICAVETEQAGVDYKPSIFHSFGRGIRRGLLGIGRFFYRIFTIRQIPEDHANSVVFDIAQNGMVANRVFWKNLIFSVLTLGIYQLYLVEVMAESVNLACVKDGKRTWGALPVALLSILTIGIYPVFWYCGVIHRIRRYLKENGMHCPISRKYFVLWYVPGMLCLVGPFIAYRKYLQSYNMMCTAFNTSHTFPIAKEELEREAAMASAARAAEKAAVHKALAGDAFASGGGEFPWEILDDLPDEVPPFDPTAASEDAFEDEAVDCAVSNTPCEGADPDQPK